MVVFGRRVQRNQVTPPVPWVSVTTAAASALYVHLAEPAAQVNDSRLSPVPSLSVVTAAAPAESFSFETVAQVEEPDPSFAQSSASVDSAAGSVAATPSTLPVQLVSVIAAAASAL